MLNTIRHTIQEFPAKFWVLVIATFIDRLGGTILFPYFSLYVTQKFNVGMTEAGILLGIFSLFGFIGNILGGALADKLGRRGMVLFGLIFSALSSFSMGFVTDLSVFYGLAMAVGLLSDIGGPARQAMVADILPAEKQAEGFGILRVAANLSWIIGPSIGGLLAARSYLILFVIDAVGSIITALIVYLLITETQQQKSADEPVESLWQTLIGYRVVVADKAYVAFVITSMVMLVVYQQMYNTLSVFLRDVRGVPPQGYGLLLSIDAGLVVLLQFWVTRRIKNFPPMVMMAAGSAFYLVGFTMYGFVTAYWLYVTAILIITVGEMIVIPVGQALAARFAPAAMRGRYMAFFSLTWTIPAAVGPWAAGVIMDNYNPLWVWYGGGILCAVAMVGFYALHIRLKARFAVQVAPVEG